MAARIFFLSCLVLLSTIRPASQIAHSADGVSPDIVIAGTQIREVFDDFAPGPYNEAIALLTASFDGEVSIRPMPVKRAQRAFFEGQADCFFVGTEQPSFYHDRGIGSHDLLLSNGINFVTMRAFTLPGTHLVSGREDLSGKTVAVDAATGGNDFIKARYLPKDTKLIGANNLQQALALLSQRRVDVIIAFDFDMSLFLNQQDQSIPLQFDRSFAVAQNNDVVACKRSKATEALVLHINEQLALLESSGRLAELLAPLRLAQNGNNDY